ncbi:MAG: alanine racemase [Chloroflexi bacterium]|nr:alanine racemase [Chloroflexota bacterium]MCL5273785.1 alanine racemase [Chloroflexota bacterium]
MVPVGTRVEDLDTPAMLVDLDRMEHNIRDWQSAIHAHGVGLRPHVKTHKAPDIARMQLAAGATGITVAKVSEAEVFAAGGARDIFIAYPIIGSEKWRRAAALAQTCKIIAGVDSETGARGLSEAAVAAGTTLGVRIEIDGGLNRSGVPVDRAESLCRLVAQLPGLKLDGIFGFRSVFYAGAGGRPASELGREEGQFYVAVADQLRAAGIAIDNISVGSTPTARYAAAAPGVTEVRPGTYIFGDYMMAEIGAIRYEDIALSILCTVVSRPAGNKATVDGGSKTFCGDSNPARLNLKGYARAVGQDAYVVSMSEEHGVVELGPDVSYSIGDKVAFYPIHVCTTVNLADELIGVRNGRVATVWPILARGKRT